MKKRAYKDLKELSITLKSIMDCSDAITNNNYQEIKDRMKFLIGHANNDLIDLLMEYLDDEEDVNTKYLLNKTKRNLLALEMTCLDRIDPSKFDYNVILAFREKIFKWVEYYYKISADLMRTYYPDRSGKIALCCIAKRENNYIREFVEHYKNIGFDHITIYDNNDNDYEDVKSRINDYVESGFVDIINAHGKKTYQLPAYKDFWINNYMKYDWIAYFDVDEFLILNKDKNIHDYISRDCFNDAKIIHINWKMYGDSENVNYEDKPILERFTIPSEKPSIRNIKGFCVNDHIKSIINTSIGLNIEFKNPHTIFGNYITKNGNGEPIINEWFTNYVYDLAQLNHYHTKTIEEYLSIRYNRGCADTYRNKTVDILVKDFYSLNSESEDKNKFIKSFKKKYEK